MNQKLSKVTKEIEKIRAKISALQARLQELEQQKTELENAEYVDIVRSMDLTPQQLAELLGKYTDNPEAYDCERDKGAQQEGTYYEG